jgi:ABC-type transport system substrate-binding protein
MNSYAELNIEIPAVSKKLNHLEIHSVSEYVLFDDLLRPLIKLDSNGSIAPDLAESWQINDKFEIFDFKLRPNQYFSDHSTITAEDVVTSFELLIKKSGVVHGDSRNIKSVTALNDFEFRVELVDSDPFFIEELAAPEYRIIKKSHKNYNITSGSYYIASNSSEKIHLELNNYFPFEGNVKFKKVSYNSNISSSTDSDIIWPKSTITKNEINEIKNKGFYIHQFNIGFSYWLSLNPNTLSKDERIQIKTNLELVFKTSDLFSKNNLIRSHQLFLPYGPGRLSDIEIEKINTNLDKEKNLQLKKLKILLPKNIQAEILNNIKTAFSNSEINFYLNFEEYAQLVQTTPYDISLVNNDFSCIDLRSSLMVTFNSSRPLIWTNNNDTDYSILLKNITTEINSLKRYALIKKVGEQILADVLVYPLYYKYGYVFVKNGIDLSALNKLGVETLSWKIK